MGNTPAMRATAHYVGTGSTDEAQNFVCRLKP